MSRAKPTALLACFGSALQDPPTRNAAQYLLEQGWHVTILQRDQRRATGAPIHGDCRLVEALRTLGGGRATRIAEIAAFAIKLNYLCRRLQPDALVGVMLHAYGLINAHVQRKARVTVCSILDIPVPGASGKLNEPIFSRGMRRLRSVDVIWASDKYKGRDIRKLASLDKDPIICHNCPKTSYITGDLWPRNPWLRLELQRRLGHNMGEEMCILLRSGALGEHGGIEETLSAIREVKDVVFVLAGQISKDYQQRLESYASRLGVERRFTIFKAPSDEIWNLCLRGADIGHMIHFRPGDGYHQQAYDLNSCLSNNRLFQYMAAGLPILVNDDPRLQDIARQVPCFEPIRQERALEDLRGKISGLSRLPNRRIDLGTVGRRAHEMTFHWEHQFAPVYDALTAKLGHVK